MDISAYDLDEVTRNSRPTCHLRNQRNFFLHCSGCGFVMKGMFITSEYKVEFTRTGLNLDL